jgi:hypothetical protein
MHRHSSAYVEYADQTTRRLCLFLNYIVMDGKAIGLD